MRFSENMSIHELGKMVMEKVNSGGKDHSLFQPAPESDHNSCGKWLRPDRTIEYYDLKNNDTLHYKKKHEVLKIKLVDDTVKTVLIDTSLSVSDIVDVLGKKINLKNAEEYALQADINPGIWLKGQMSIPEQVSTMDQMFILKKKFFVNDANIDQDDPVQLHLIYCQNRDDIVSGSHPVTKDESIMFASLQMQIQNGDYKPSTHVAGSLSLKDCLQEQYQKREHERLIFQEWKKLVGMTEVNARFRYVQLCRSLKTYGMTCFRVKEKVPAKKKLMDALLCFTRDTILRMEYESKKVIKEYPLKHLLRWAASPETFTMDFGAYEEDYIVVVTQEGEAISNLIAGYIDLLLKKQKAAAVVIEDDDAEIAEIASLAKQGGAITSSITSSIVGGGNVSYSQGATDTTSAAKAIERMVNDLFGEIAKINDSNLTPEQRKQQLEGQAKAVQLLAETIENLAKTGDRSAMNAASHKIAAAVEQLIAVARQAYATGVDPQRILLDTTKGVSDALKNLLQNAQMVVNKPNDIEAKEALAKAHATAQAALAKLTAVSRGIYGDDGFQNLFKEMAKAVTAEANDILNQADILAKAIPDVEKKNQFMASEHALSSANEQFAKVTDIIAPTAQDAQCRGLLERNGKGLETSSAYLMANAKTLGLDPKALQSIAEAHQRLLDALSNLTAITELPDIKAAKEADDFTDAAQAILQATAAIMAADGQPGVLKLQSAEIKNGATKLGTSGKAIITAQNDPALKERMANYLKSVVEATKKLLQAVPEAVSNPTDKAVQKKVREAASEVAEATHQLIGDTGKLVAISALFTSAKMAAAATTGLVTSSKVTNGKMNDEESRKQLADASRAAAEAVQKLVGVLKNVSQDDGKKHRPSMLRKRGQSVSQADDTRDDIMHGAEQFAPVAYKLVSTAKAASGKVIDDERKQDLVYHSNEAAKAIHRMLANRKAMKAVKGQLETAEAIEEFKASQADLESALISADTGILQKTKGRDEALNDLATAMKELASMTKEVANTARNSPEDLGPVMKRAAQAVTKAVAAATALAAAVDDKVLQKGILNAMKGVTHEMKNLLTVAKAVAANPEDANLGKLLLDAGKGVADSLVKLTEASKGVVPKKVEEFQQKASNEIESLAEQELKGAADVIERCVAKLNAATQAARQRAAEKGIDIEEQNITEAILEAAQAIAKATGALVASATLVQQEFQKLIAEPKTANVYKRDPQWAQGLISAARTVAGAVQHLVKAANSAALGNASEEELVVAAQAVSAATAQLVTASTVKADPNSAAQSKLREASSKVTAATQQLVSAAKQAAAWEEEQSKVTGDAKFTLAETKIQEMEKQMQILRLEKELEKARQALGTMRKKEYESNTNPEFQPSQPQVPPPVKPSRPLPKTGAPLKQTGVNWNQSNLKSNSNGNVNPNSNGNSNPAPAPQPAKQTGPAPVKQSAPVKQNLAANQPRPLPKPQ